MISVMRWTAKVQDVQILSVAVCLELSWDQMDRHAWVRQMGTEEERGLINCISRDKPGDTEDR